MPMGHTQKIALNSSLHPYKGFPKMLFLTKVIQEKHRGVTYRTPCTLSWQVS